MLALPILALPLLAALAGDGAPPCSYSVAFGPDAVGFTLESPTGPQTLTLRLASVGREHGASGSPRVVGRARDVAGARYERGSLVERYDRLPHGLEQSFVFDALPPGRGDLVVRVAVATELPLVHAGNDAVVLGDVRVGDAVGIDADGRRAAGGLTWRDGMLELRLPAAFVDVARLPLVLDPLVGDAHVVAATRLIGTSSRPREIVTAWLPGADRYLTAWSDESFDECGTATAGRLLTASGVPEGPVLSFLDPGGSFPCFAFDPAVASSVGAQRFVVLEAGGSEEASGYFASVNPATMQATRPVVVFPGIVGAVDVGGEATGSGAVLGVAVTSNFVSRGVQMASIDAVDGSVLASAPLTSDATDDDVAIASSGGTAGRYLIVWRRGSLLQPTAIWGAVVAADLTVLDGPFPITDGSAGSDDAPDVDGDGVHWVVAFERGPAGDGDVFCASVAWDAATGTARVGGAEPVEDDAGQDERNPSVAWAGESFLVSYSEQFSGADYDVYVESLESFDCLSCEGRVLVSDPPTPDEGISVATQRAAGGTGDGAMLVWLASTTQVLTGSRVVANAMARPWRSDDGVVRDLGGGCGTGGVADATCARVGAQHFGLRLEGATPSALAGVLLGLSRLDLVCGPCTLVVDPTDAIVMPTDAGGRAEVSIPLPAPVSIQGTVFLAQWLVAGPSGCGSFSFSNALEITVD